MYEQLRKNQDKKGSKIRKVPCEQRERHSMATRADTLMSTSSPNKIKTQRLRQRVYNLRTSSIHLGQEIVCQRAIVIDDEEYSNEQGERDVVDLTALLAQKYKIAAHVTGIEHKLCNYDIENRTFQGIDQLVHALETDLGGIKLETHKDRANTNVMKRKGRTTQELNTEIARMEGGITKDEEVAAAVAGGENKYVYLMRGISNDEKGRNNAEHNKMGRPEAALNFTRVTEKEALYQVGGPTGKRDYRKSPEFTADPVAAKKWGLSGGYLFAIINTKYLRRGDVGQCGWVCASGTPLIDSAYVETPNPIEKLNVIAD